MITVEFAIATNLVVRNVDEDIALALKQLAASHGRSAVQTIVEIRRGVENIRSRGDAAQATRLEQWLNGLVEGYADRILGFDQECAQVWGKLMSHSQHVIDKQIAAIALIQGLKVVTRNMADFSGIPGLALKNPFTHELQQ